jgi:EpsI family protein
MAAATLRRRLILLGTAGGLALLSNWLRVFIIIVVGHATDMQHFLVKIDHYYFGWVIFAVVLVGYIQVSSRWLDQYAQRDAPPAQAGIAGSGSLTLTGLTIIALALGPVWLQVESRRDVPAGHPASPPDVPGWSKPAAFDSIWQPAFVNTDVEYLVAYSNDASVQIGLYRALYFSQRQCKELRSEANSLTGPSLRVGESTHRTIVINGRTVEVSELIGQDSAGREVLIWSLYDLDGRPALMNLRSQLLYGSRSILGTPSAGVTAISLPCQADCDAARAVMLDFAASALPTI